MGNRKGQGRSKIAQIDMENAEDAVIINETKNPPKNKEEDDDVIDFTDDSGKSGKTEKPVDKNDKKTEKTTKTPPPPPKSEDKIDTSFLTDPDALKSKIKLQEPSSSSVNPLEDPLANETEDEGNTMKRMGFTMDEPDDFEPIEPEPLHATSGGMGAGAGGGSVPPPPPRREFVDDIPQPNPNDNDIFDEMDDDGGLDTGGGLSIPPDLNKWAATRQADWIVDTEDRLITGFLRNRAKLPVIEIRQRLLKYKTPADLNNDVLDQAKNYNIEVDNYIKLDNAGRKMLKKGWTKVLSKHSEVASNISDEAQLVVTHLILFGGMFMAGNQLKKVGLEVLNNIDESIKAHAAKFEANQKWKKPEAKKEEPKKEDPKKDENRSGGAN